VDTDRERRWSGSASASRLPLTPKNVEVHKLITGQPKVLQVTATEDTWNDDQNRNTTHGNDTRLGIADASGTACFILGSASCTTIKNARTHLKFDLTALPSAAPGEGGLVIHRIVGGDSRTGFVMQGDHNRTPDIWMPRQDDMIGRKVLLVPQAGEVLAWIRQPVILAAVAAGLVTTFALLGRGERTGSGRGAARSTGRAPPTTGTASGSSRPDRGARRPGRPTTT